MGEVGCLKDGNFQNLETQQLMLGGSRIDASLESSGILQIDAAATGAIEFAKNSILFMSAVNTDARTITLPELSTLQDGDKFLFIIGIAMNGGVTAGHTLQISTAGTDGPKIVGSVMLSHTGVDTATIYSDKMISTGPPKTNIVCTEGATDGDVGAVGTKLLLTVVGGSTHFLLSGIAMSNDVDGTNAGSALFS